MLTQIWPDPKANPNPKISSQKPNQSLNATHVNPNPPRGCGPKTPLSFLKRTVTDGDDGAPASLPSGQTSKP